MSDKKNSIYVDLFKRLYLDKKIIADWRSEVVGLRSNIDLKNEISQLGEDFTEKQFIETAFSILNTARDMTLGNDISEVDEYIKTVAKELFVSDSERREHIAVRCTSKTNIFEGIHYEILTKRNARKPKEIIGYSALLNILSKESFTDSDKQSVNKLTIEVSKLEIEEIIETLQNILNDIESVR